VVAHAALGPSLVVRSSSRLEAGGEWAGAFTSYVGIGVAELTTALRGCWASAFSPGTLARAEAAGIAPGDVPMAVLVQPAVEPQSGGSARLEGDMVVVTAVRGSPVALLQGWEPGVTAGVDAAGAIVGQAAVRLLGAEGVHDVARRLRQAEATVGATACEWAIVEGRVILLQLARAPRPAAVNRLEVPDVLRTPEAARMAQLVRRAPGPLGEGLVLPWAIADPRVWIDLVDARSFAERPNAAPGTKVEAGDALAAWRRASSLARTLRVTAWGEGDGEEDRAAGIVRGLRGTEPGDAFAAATHLAAPDREVAHGLEAELRTVRSGLADLGVVADPELAWQLEPAAIEDVLARGSRPPRRLRVGFDRWEPFVAAVTLATGRATTGVAASGGIGAGRLTWVTDPGQPQGFRSRDVVAAPRPLPHLAPLLWDAAALVTTGGGPAAHLFESARALGIPAVASVDLGVAIGHDPGGVGEDDPRLAAVDGDAATVAFDRW
jgi:hypothetical protein